MKNIKLYICTGDPVYMERLKGYISAKEGSPFSVDTMDDYHSAAAAVIRDENAILFCDADKVDRENLPDEKRTFILHSGILPSELSDYQGVFRYKRSSEIYDALYSFYFDADRGIIKTDESKSLKYSELLAIFSPDRGVDSYSYVKKLKEMYRGRKLLLIDWDDFSSISEEEEGLAELAFYAKGKHADMRARIDRMAVKTGEMHIISPSGSINRISELEADSINNLFDMLKTESGFDAIAVHFAFLPQDMGVFNKFSRVFLPIKADGISEKSIERFERMREALGVFEETEYVKVRV